MLKSNLVCENLSYFVDDKNLFSNLSLSLGNEKTGLVGSNGVGKTTLLKLIIGELVPKSGVVNLNCKVGYMPQNFVINENQTIAEIFGIDQKIRALEKINSGLGNQQDFDVVGDDWNAVEKVKDCLQKCNLNNLDLSRQVKTLSGGQVTRLFFARLLSDKSDFLILDEPTNNLDAESRLALCEVIKNFDGGILVVSHDRELLSLMDQIMELSPLGLKTYGGNYADYVEQKRIEQETLGQDLIDAQKDLNKARKTVQLSKERYDKRTKMGNKVRHQGGQPKVFLDFKKGRAEVTKSKLEKQTDKQLEDMKDKLIVAKSKLEQKELLDFELEATRVHNTKLVLEISDLVFVYYIDQTDPSAWSSPVVRPERNELLASGVERVRTENKDLIISNFNMTLVGPKRIAISGKNGSGKTTLLKLIMGELTPTSGSIKVGVQYCVYLDQNLSILDPNQTIFENFKRLNPDVKETDCRLRLAAFLFAHDDALKLVCNLSGGERMRAALACVLMGDTPPQLILLDEPTNNMDLESIASIERVFKNYKGALIVISHDATFLQNIGVDEKIELLKLR